MGLAIRPVYFIPIESVSLNESQIEVNNFQRSVALKATVSPIDAMHKHFVWEADIPNVVYYIPYEGGDSRTVSFGILPTGCFFISAQWIRVVKSR